MMFGHGYGVLYGLGDLLGSILWIVILVAAILFVVRLMGGGPGRHHRHWMGGAPWMNQGALEILRERFAKGEINKEEYEERRKVLSEDK